MISGYTPMKMARRKVMAIILMTINTDNDHFVIQMEINKLINRLNVIIKRKLLIKIIEKYLNYGETKRVKLYYVYGYTSNKG